MSKELSRRQMLAASLAASSLPLLGEKVSAQTSWPNKPIRIVAGFAAAEVDKVSTPVLYPSELGLTTITAC